MYRWSAPLYRLSCIFHYGSIYTNLLSKGRATHPLKLNLTQRETHIPSTIHEDRAKRMIV